MDYAESYQQNLENFLISAKYGDFFMLNPLSNGSLDWDVKFDEYGTLSLSINNERNVTESGFRNGVELIFDLGKGRFQKKKKKYGIFHTLPKYSFKSNLFFSIWVVV